MSSIKNGSDSPIVIPTEVGHVSDHSYDSSSSQTKRTDAQSDREHEHICRGPNRMTAVGRTVGERSEDKCSARVPHLLATPDDSAALSIAITDVDEAPTVALANVLAGKDNYEITGGDALFEGKSLADLEPEERAQLGLFLAFQYPVEIPGVSNMEFLKAALEATRKAQGKEEWDSVTLLRKARETCKQVDLDPQFLKRGVNEGFSGGEKKRNEIMQMLLMEPKLALLDETDSGLDIDALQTVARGVNSLRSPERGIVLVTHYQRLLDYIVPDFVHVLSNGQIIKSGGKELAHELEEHGYGWLTGDRNDGKDQSA